MHTLDCERTLVGEGIQQSLVLGTEQWTWSVLRDAQYTDRAASGAHGQEQPFRTGQGVGIASGNAIVFPGPLGGSQIGLLNGVFWRIACLYRNGAIFGQEQHDSDLEHRRDLMSRRPQHV